MNFRKLFCFHDYEIMYERKRELLNDKRISPVRKLSDYYGVKLKMSETAKHKLAKEAAENGMGVRFIHSQIQRRLDYELFENCDRKEYVIA